METSQEAIAPDAPATDTRSPSAIDYTQAIRDKMEHRKMEVDGVEYSFPILTVNSPELWLPASEIKGSFNMVYAGTDRSMRFSMTGISLNEWEKIEQQNIIPEWMENGVESPEFLAKKKLAIEAKNIAILEAALCMKFPGKNVEEKITFLRKRVPGEVDSIYNHVQMKICNWVGGEDPTLLMQYNQLNQVAIPKVIDFKDFADWKEAAETQYIFRMQRPSDDYIIEVPIHGISKEVKENILEETKESDPPLVPVWNSRTGRMDPSLTKPNFLDASWLKRSRAIHQKRTTMYLESCLPFNIPGSDQKQKYEWISHRLVGDVLRFQNFIESELMGYGARYKSF